MTRDSKNIAGVHLIAAVGLSGQIGLDGKVPWRGDPSLEEHTARDLAQFAQMTAGGVLIMGSVTAQSLPHQFQWGDRTIYIWRQNREEFLTPELMLKNLREAYPYRDIWICGGQKVYELFTPFVDWHHVSVIPYDGPADRYMPPMIPALVYRDENRV